MPNFRAEKAEKTRQEILDRHFPDWHDEWFIKTAEQGWTTVPRTIGLLARLAKELSDKGEDPSRVYQDLWYRAFGETLVEIRDEREAAYASCLKGNERGVRSWRQRMVRLRSLGFIKTAKRFDQEFYYIFLRHPDAVVQDLEDAGRLPDAWRQEYLKKLTEVRANRWKRPAKRTKKTPVDRVRRTLMQPMAVNSVN